MHILRDKYVGKKLLGIITMSCNEETWSVSFRMIAFDRV